MDHSYQLSRPSIETIIDYCNDLLADEKLTVFEFGENCDLVLHIYKDEEFNPALDKDYSNIVTIHTAQDGKWIDDTEDVYVTDGSLYRELERIYDFGGLAEILYEVIKEVEEIDLLLCTDSGGKTYLIYMPSYPWTPKTEKEKELTEEKLENMFRKYLRIVTDEQLPVDYKSVENFS